MKSLILLTLLASLVMGCASAGQAEADLMQAANTNTPASTAADAPLVTLAPTRFAPPAGVPLAYYEWGYHLRLVDPATGEAISEHKPVLISQDREYVPIAVLSPEGSRLAAVQEKGQTCVPYGGGSSCYPQATALFLIDVASWEVITSTLPADGWVSQIAFGPRDDRLAVSYNDAEGSTLILIDASSGETLGSHILGIQPEGMSFFQGGQALVAYGTLPGDEPGVSKPEGLRLEAISVPTLERLWQRDLLEVTSGNWCMEGCQEEHGLQLYANWAPAIVLAADENILYLYHADQDLLTRISLADGSSEDVQVQAAQSWIERLLAATAGVALAKGGSEGTTRQAVISPDGQRLYVLSTTIHSELNKDGFWEPISMVTELQVIDPQSGQLLARKPASGYELRLSPDGEYLLIDEWKESGMDSEIWAVDGLESVARSNGWELVFSPDLDGSMLLLGKKGTNTTTELAQFDAQTFQILNSWNIKGRAHWIPAR